MRKKVLVTGSAGFIGKHTVEGLLALDHKVIGADKVTGIDLSRPNVADSVGETHRADLIVHLAASCSTSGSLVRPMGTFGDTVIAGANVIEFARKWMVPIVVVSSVKARDGQTPYGAAKRMVELWAKDYQDSFGVPVIIVRPGTIYGPGQEGSTESGWVAWFLKAKSQGITITINGDGSQVRDLLHVSDLVNLFQKMVEDPSLFVGKTWDVGGGERNAVTVEQMAKFLGLRYEFGGVRRGDAQRYVGINDAPRWQPQVAWEDGIRRLM